MRRSKFSEEQIIGDGSRKRQTRRGTDPAAFDAPPVRPEENGRPVS